MSEDPTIARGRQLIKEGKAKEAVLLYEQRIRNLNAQLSQKPVSPPPLSTTTLPVSPPSPASSRVQMPVIIQQRAGPSCLKQLIIGCGGLVVVGIVITVVLIVLTQAGQEAADEEAADMNNGRGALANPIPAGEWAKFEQGSVRATQMTRPANAQVEEFNPFNEDAPVGADYVLLWVEMECKQEKCNARTDIKLHLLDANGETWGEPTFMVLDNDLDGQEVLRGNTVAGWQVFEYPTGEEIKALEITWGIVDLYTQLPIS